MALYGDNERDTALIAEAIVAADAETSRRAQAEEARDLELVSVASMDHLVKDEYARLRANILTLWAKQLRRTAIGRLACRLTDRSELPLCYFSDPEYVSGGRSYADQIIATPPLLEELSPEQGGIKLGWSFGVACWYPDAWRGHAPLAYCLHPKDSTMNVYRSATDLGTDIVRHELVYTVNTARDKPQFYNYYDSVYSPNDLSYENEQRETAAMEHALALATDASKILAKSY